MASGKAARGDGNSLLLWGSLLGSSCCLVQLAMNTISFGCVGLGWLEPFRGVFLMLTAGATIRMLLGKQALWKKILILVCVLLISVAPEMLEAAGITVDAGPGPGWSLQEEPHFSLSIPTMGCGGCRKAVLAAIHSIPGISSKVDLDNKMAHVWITGIQPPDIRELVTEAIHGSGHRVAVDEEP